MKPDSGFLKSHEWSPVGLKANGLVKEFPYLIIILIPLVLAYSATGVFESARGMANYAPLHSILELFAVIVAATAFLVGWFGSLDKRSIEASVLPALFLCVAILDISHVLSYPGMADFVTASTPHKAIVAWLMARMVAAFALLLVAFIYWRGPVYSSSWRPLSLVVSLLIAFLGSFIVIVHPDWFPATFIAGEGLTPLKVNIEYLLIFMNISAGVIFIYARHVPRYIFNVRYLAWAAFLMAVSEWCFTLYADVTDLYNLVGHFYKVMAYVIILRVLVIGLIARPVSDLQESEEKLRELTAYMDDIREDERTKMARDLHDELGSNLVGISMDINHLQRLHLNGNGDKINHKLGDMSQLTRKTLDALRCLITELRPAILDDLGLVATIEWQLDDFSERNKISSTIEIPPKISLPQNKATITAIYRILQESLSNIVKHANASKVKVTLCNLDNKLLLCVEDDGVGMPESVEKLPGSFGVLGMRERAIQISGNLDFGVSSLGGAKLTLAIPL